jgi:hypothetical protein
VELAFLVARAQAWGLYLRVGLVELFRLVQLSAKAAAKAAARVSFPPRQSLAQVPARLPQGAALVPEAAVPLVQVKPERQPFQ